MRFRDILAIVTSQMGDEHVIAFAEQLAQQNSAHLSTLVVNWRPAAPPPLEGYVVDPMWSELASRCGDRLAAEVAKVKRRLERDATAVSPESMLIEMVVARPVIGLRAKHADLTIVGRPTKAAADSAHALLEGPLFESGRPVIVVPPEWTPREIGRSVLVCWKPTREAVRALADAGDFLTGARNVTVVTVDARPSVSGYGEHPGADIAAHLARRGVKVELVNIDSTGRSDAKAIQDQAVAVNADLIVMGGYGRSRMSEFIFGGVTREMLKTAGVPVLMSH